MLDVFECHDIVKKGDIIFDHANKILGNCCYKEKDGKNFICLEKGTYIIWIKGYCMKHKNGWLFIEGEKKVYYKDL